MRKNTERPLVIAVVLVSVTMTGLTVWTVGRQETALRQRDWSDLCSAALRAAEQRAAALRADLDRAFLTARLAWQTGQASPPDRWLHAPGPWTLAVLLTAPAEWTTYPLGESERPAAELVDELARHVNAIVAPVGRPATTPAGFAADGVAFHTVRPENGEEFIVAVRDLSPPTQLALAAPLSRLVERYWADPPEQPWQVVFARRPGTPPPLCVLGPAFAHAELVPTPATLARLKGYSRRGMVLVTATAVGTAGAWGIVIWLVLRAMARQRELARLQRRFVADVSHELKTPLTMIRLLAETLADGRIRDAERVRTYHQTITREAERLSVLLDGILDFSRVETGSKRPLLVECDVAALARQAWALFEPQLAAEGFERRLELAADLPTIQADAAALQQVLVNLLQNAYRYAGDGKYVRLSVAREGYLIVFTVEDRGIGMTPAQLARLGDSFFRAEDTRVRKTRGTGLGLAIVDRIVRAHGGKLEAHSRPGQGSKFTVWIPFEPPPEDPPKA